MSDYRIRFESQNWRFRLGWGVPTGVPRRAKCRQVNLIKISLRIEFSRPANLKIHKNVLVRTMCGEDEDLQSLLVTRCKK